MSAWRSEGRARAVAPNVGAQAQRSGGRRELSLPPIKTLVRFAGSYCNCMLLAASAAICINGAREKREIFGIP